MNPKDGVRAIVDHETLKAAVGDAVVSIPVDTPFTARAIAKRAGVAESTVMLFMLQFKMRQWVVKGPETPDGRETWQQAMRHRRGWETYREALRDVVEGKAIDVEEEARLRLHQQGLEGTWE